RGGGRDRVVDVDRRGGGRGGPAPRVFGRLGVGRGGGGVVAAAPAGAGDAHSDRAAVWAGGRNRGAPGGACQDVAWVNLYFVEHRHAVPRRLDRHPGLQRGER